MAILYSYTSIHFCVASNASIFRVTLCCCTVLLEKHFAYTIISGMIKHSPKDRWTIQKAIDTLLLKKPNIKKVEDEEEQAANQIILAAYSEAHRALCQSINSYCQKLESPIFSPLAQICFDSFVSLIIIVFLIMLCTNMYIYIY